MHIELATLAVLSNNSVITHKVCNTLNEKLTDEEKREFKQWLSIVTVEHQMALNRAKSPARMGLRY